MSEHDEATNPNPADSTDAPAPDVDVDVNVVPSAGDAEEPSVPQPDEGAAPGQTPDESASDK